MNHLETISLDELVQAAALQTRVDRKYILRADDAEKVLENLDATTRVLEIDGQRASTYESVYFDTPSLLSYRMAATGGGGGSSCAPAATSTPRRRISR